MGGKGAKVEREEAGLKGKGGEGKKGDSRVGTRAGELRAGIKMEPPSVGEVKEDTFTAGSFLKLAPFILYVLLIPLFKWQIEYVWSKIAVAYISMALAGLVIAYMNLKEKKISINIPKTAIAVFLFMIWGLLSSLWSYNSYKVHQLVVMIAPGFLAYIAVQFLNLNIMEIKVIAFAIAFTSAVVSGYGILQIVGVYDMPPDQYGNPNPITTFGLSNFAVEYLLLAFPLTVAFAIAERGLLRWLFLFSALITFLYIFGAKNRAGWVGAITFFLSLGFIYSLHLIRNGFPVKKLLKYSSVFILLLALFLSFFMMFTDYGKSIALRFKSFVQIGPGSSVSTRLLAWDAGFDMIAKNPIVGVGAGNYEIFSWKYAPRLLDELTMHTNTRVDKSHNEYLQIFADLGIVGFSIFIVIILVIFSVYMNIFKRAEEYDFFVATGLFLGVFSLLASASFNFSLQWPGSVTHFWLYIGLLELIGAKTRGESPLDIRLNKRPFLALIPGFLIFALAVGAPCINGIPFCNKGPCIWRKICVVSPGFFAARNLTLAEIYYRIGQFHKRFRNFDISERYYLASLKHENPAERTYYDLAYLYFGKNQGRIDGRVIGLLENVLKLVPYFGKGRRELGRMYIQIGDINKGIEYVLSSTDSNPANIPEAYAIVADTYLMVGNYEQALMYASMALEEIENSPSKKKYGLPIPRPAFDETEIRGLALFVLGSSYARLQRYDEAEKYLKMAMELNPNSQRIIFNLSTVYINQERFEEAEKLLNSFEPKDDMEKAAKLFNLASLYAGMGDKSKAMDFLQAASSIDPSMYNRAFYDKFLKKILE